MWNGNEDSRDWRRDLRRVMWLKASVGMEVSLLEYKDHERLNAEVWMWNDD